MGVRSVKTMNQIASGTTLAESLADPALPLELRVSLLGEHLSQSFARVIAALPGAPLRPMELSRLLGVDAMLTSRLLKAVHAGDSLAVAHLMPGPEPLRRIIKSAERRGIDPSLVSRAADAADEFERLIDREAGDRAGLDAIISGFLPEAREKYELASKQAAFKGMSQIKGLSIESEISTAFFAPCASDSRRVDRAMLLGKFGVRRLRPGVRIEFGSGTPRGSTAITPAGDGIPPSLSTVLLKQYSSSPIPRFEVQTCGDLCFHWMVGSQIGIRSAADLVMAEYAPSVGKRFRTSDGRLWAAAITVQDAPAKRLTKDVFVHRDLYPDTSPELLVYDTIPRGPARFNDLDRENDRLPVIESIASLGWGTSNARLAHVARYVEMLEHVCSLNRWDPNAFRAYRLDVAFPVYGAQYMMGFKLPHELP